MLLHIQQHLSLSVVTSSIIFLFEAVNTCFVLVSVKFAAFFLKNTNFEKSKMVDML